MACYTNDLQGDVIEANGDGILPNETSSLSRPAPEDTISREADRHDELGSVGMKAIRAGRISRPRTRPPRSSSRWASYGA